MFNALPNRTETQSLSYSFSGEYAYSTDDIRTIKPMCEHFASQKESSCPDISFFIMIRCACKYLAHLTEFLKFLRFSRRTGLILCIISSTIIKRLLKTPTLVCTKSRCCESRKVSLQKLTWGFLVTTTLILSILII